MSERLPPPDPRRIAGTIPTGDELIVPGRGTIVVRIHPLGGPHPCSWDEFRFLGPTTSRFDHQPPPRRIHPRRAVCYLTTGPTAVPAALAEYFQDAAGRVGLIDAHHRQPALTAFELAQPVTLLDLDGGWVTRAGGNQVIRTGPRGRSRDWARAIYRHHPGIDGLAYGSSIWGPGRCFVLWERARRAVPAAPLASRTLADPALRPVLAHAARILGTVVV